MAPAPPKRPSSPPRRATSTGARPLPRRAPEPDTQPDPEEAPAGNSNDTILGMDFDPDSMPDSTSPGARGDAATIDESGDEPPPPADATVVFDTRNLPKGKSPAAGPVGKLIVLKGPKQGAEFTLGPGETSIGRNADNTIVIPDISVSRKHVVLVKQGAGWLLQDQGSGNGTLMNGEKVGEHPLQDGEVFVIGDTEIQFQLQGGAPAAPRRSSSAAIPAPPRRTPSRVQSLRPVPGKPLATGDSTGQIALPPGGLPDPARAKRLKMMLGAVAGLGLLVGGLVVVKNQREATAAAAANAARAAEQHAKQEQADRDVVEGKQLVADGKFSEALPKFLDAKEQGDSDPDVDEYINRCKREQTSEQALKDAHEALSKSQLALAMETAKKIPVDSLLSDKAADLKQQVLKAVPGRVAEARGKIATKDWAGAAAILEDADKVSPGDKTISDAQDELAKAQNKPPPVHVTQKVTKVADHSAEIVQAFKDGDLKRAKDLAAQYGESDDNAKRLGQELAQFESAYAKMDDDPAAFRTAHDLDLRIAKGHSFFSQKINTHVLSVSLKQCVSSKTAGKLGDAYRYCAAAHDADPSNAEANGVLAELQTKAKETYLDAYQQMGSDPETARKEFNQVVSITPASDEYHQKAAARLKELNNQ